MTDLDAIRARHVIAELKVGGDATWCKWDTADWPCDTAIVLAALDAALARERRLREAAEALLPIGSDGLDAAIAASRDAALADKADVT